MKGVLNVQSTSRNENAETRESQLLNSIQRIQTLSERVYAVKLDLQDTNNMLYGPVPVAEDKVEESKTGEGFIDQLRQGIAYVENNLDELVVEMGRLKQGL